MSTYETATLLVQGLAAVAVVLTLVVYFRQMRTMERQVQAMEREMAARMRPWIGMFDFGFAAAALPETADVLRVLLRNSGALPAQNARLTLRFYPISSPSDSDSGTGDASVEWAETGVKALVPGEEGNYAISLAPYPQISLWRDAGKDVVVEGVMSYALEDRSFRSKFLACLRFSEELDASGNVRTRWRNLEVL
jgi:hypothetical protein